METGRKPAFSSPSFLLLLLRQSLLYIYIYIPSGCCVVGPKTNGCRFSKERLVSFLRLGLNSTWPEGAAIADKALSLLSFRRSRNAIRVLPTFLSSKRFSLERLSSAKGAHAPRLREAIRGNRKAEFRPGLRASLNSVYVSSLRAISKPRLRVASFACCTSARLTRLKKGRQEDRWGVTNDG